MSSFIIANNERLIDSPSIHSLALALLRRHLDFKGPSKCEVLAGWLANEKIARSRRLLSN